MQWNSSIGGLFIFIIISLCFLISQIIIMWCKNQYEKKQRQNLQPLLTLDPVLHETTVIRFNRRASF